MKNLAGKVRLWFRCVSEISLKHTWKLTLQSAFPVGLEPLSLLISPLTIPILFVFRLYEQYCIAKVMEAFKTLTEVLDKIMKHKQK